MEPETVLVLVGSILLLGVALLTGTLFGKPIPHVTLPRISVGGITIPLDLILEGIGALIIIIGLAMGM